MLQFNLKNQVEPADRDESDVGFGLYYPVISRLDRPVDPPYQRLVLLVQKEVAERIRARPGQSSFSALSVRMQLLAECRSVCPVPPRCFQPPPKVQSEVIALDPYPAERRLDLVRARQVESLLKQAFLHDAKCCATPSLGLRLPIICKRLLPMRGSTCNNAPRRSLPRPGSPWRRV